MSPTSNSTLTKLSDGTKTTVGLFEENWNDKATADETIHEHLRTEEDVLITSPYPGGGTFTQNDWEWHESDWTDWKYSSWDVGGQHKFERFADGSSTESATSNSTTTTQGTHTDLANWAEGFSNSFPYESSGGGSSGGSSGSSSSGSSSSGPTTTDASAPKISIRVVRGMRRICLSRGCAVWGTSCWA